MKLNRPADVSSILGNSPNLTHANQWLGASQRLRGNALDSERERELEYYSIRAGEFNKSRFSGNNNNNKFQGGNLTNSRGETWQIPVFNTYQYLICTNSSGPLHGLSTLPFGLHPGSLLHALCGTGSSIVCKTMGGKSRQKWVCPSLELHNLPMLHN